MTRHHHRQRTFPLAHTSRTKKRRWPLVLRFYKGAVHGSIIVPVVLHSLFTALIVYLDRNVVDSLGLPSSIIPSLSIVVGLMLVFRNQTSYDRFWTGRNCFTTCNTTVRNLARGFLVASRTKGVKLPHGGLSEEEQADVERTIRMLVAILYAIKHNLRGEWNISFNPTSQESASETSSLLPVDGESQAIQPVYKTLLPTGLVGFEDQGLGLPLQLVVYIEAFIQRGFDKGWFHGPQASQMTVQVNTLVDAYGKMETIRTTPIPVAHLIHQRQVLALFNCVLPFATVDDFGWWAIPICALVAFTLYGIEGIGSQLEDPFGYDKNDIKMDAIVEDTKCEVMVLLDEWKAGMGEGMFN